MALSPYRTKKRGNPFHQSTADFSLLLFMLFFFAFAALITLIKPSTTKPNEQALFVSVIWDVCLPEKSNNMLTAGQATSDLDLYVQFENNQGPQVVSYKQLKTEMLALNRDDLGGPDEADDIDQEIVTANVGKLPRGMVTVNVHAYSFKSDKPPVCAKVEVVVNKDRSYQEVVFDDVIKFTRSGEELTVVTFWINETGGVQRGSIKHDRVPIAVQGGR